MSENSELQRHHRASRDALSVIRAVHEALSKPLGVGPSREDLERLLDAARRAVSRQEVPHPCTVRCWRIGAPADLNERGTCTECGSPGTRSDPEDFGRLATPEVVLAVCEQLVSFRDAVEHPAVLAAAAVGAP
jgi:hypothetical protein